MAKILIAEDERDIRDLVSFTLTFAGYEVHTAANGREALELAPQLMPDLILLDVRMPHMTGYETCQALKQLDPVKDIPVVFLSAKGQDVEMQAGLNAGAVDYILKPFSPDDLARRVTEILEQWGVPPVAAGAGTEAVDSGEPAGVTETNPGGPAPEDEDAVAPADVVASGEGGGDAGATGATETPTGETG